MIGKSLFARPFTRPGHSPEDDLYTLNLLYGATDFAQSELAKINPDTDIRIVLLTDCPSIGYPFFDTKQSTARPQPGAISSPTIPPSSKWAGSRRSQAFADEIPSFQALQERVFGSSQIRYNGPVTKLHPFPIPNYLPTKPKDKPRQRWLVSKTFRLEKNTACTPSRNDPQEPPKPNLPNSQSTRDAPNPRAAYHAFRNGASLWQAPNDRTPSSTARRENCSTPVLISGSPDLGSTVDTETADYTFAICVFITSGIDGQSCITSYWDELTTALHQLHTDLAQKLLEYLPMTYRELRQFRNLADPYNCQQMLSFQQNEDIISAVEAFKARFMAAVRIPRVVCGQRRWPEMLAELKWTAAHFGRDFLCTTIAAFVKHSNLVSRDRRSVSAILSVPSRTVVIGEKIAARRLLFILSVLIPDQYSKPYDDSLEEPKLDHDTVPVRSASSSSLTLFPIHSGGVGWEIPKSGEPQIGEFTHIIKPGFSSGSLTSLSSNAGAGPAALRLSALHNYESLRRGNSSSFSWNHSLPRSIFGSSFFANLFPAAKSAHPELSEDMEGLSINDAKYEDEKLRTASSPPARYPERTATSLYGSANSGAMYGPRRFSYRRSSELSTSVRSNSSNCLSSWSGSAGTVATSLTSTNSNSKPGAFCLDMPALEDEYAYFDDDDEAAASDNYEDDGDGDGDLDDELAVLPRVAGFNDSLVPGFSLQAVPSSQDLDDQLAAAMQYDAPGSTTLVINTLTRKCLLFETPPADPDYSKSNVTLSSGQPLGPLAGFHRQLLELDQETQLVRLAIDDLLVNDGAAPAAAASAESQAQAPIPDKLDATATESTLRREVKTCFGLLKSGTGNPCYESYAL